MARGVRKVEDFFREISRAREKSVWMMNPVVCPEQQATRVPFHDEGGTH